MREEKKDPGQSSTADGSSHEDSASILAAIAEIAHRELGFEGEIDRAQRLIEDLELDSIRLLTLATAVEDRFRIYLDEEDEAELRTVGDLVGLVLAKQQAEEDRPGVDP